MVTRDNKDVEATENAAVERDQHDDHDQGYRPKAPMDPELRKIVERVIRRNRAGLEHLAKN